LIGPDPGSHARLVLDLSKSAVHIGLVSSRTMDASTPGILFA
jgi:hypothetical protein